MLGVAYLVWVHVERVFGGARHGSMRVFAALPTLGYLTETCEDCGIFQGKKSSKIEYISTQRVQDVI